MQADATLSNGQISVERHARHRGSFAKVTDGRKHPIRRFAVGGFAWSLLH